VLTYLALRSKDYRMYGWFALGAALIAALPAVGAGQVLEHAFHQSYALQSLWWAIAVYCVGVKVTSLRNSRRSEYSLSEPRQSSDIEVAAR
jgi:hypothetical protein